MTNGVCLRAPTYTDVWSLILLIGLGAHFFGVVVDVRLPVANMGRGTGSE